MKIRSVGGRRLSRPALGALLAIGIVAACISGCANRGARSYRIGLGPFVGFGPLYLAQEKGYFQQAGLNVELVVLTGLAERNSALKAGKIDALAAPVDYFVLSAGNNLPTTIAMSIDESDGADGIVAKSSIKTIQDLRRKRVAVQRGLPSEFFLRALLQQSGMKWTDLETVDMETAQGGAAFIAGKVDAAVIWDPWLTKAKQEGKGWILASSKEFPNLIVDCVAFNNDVVSRSPQDVQSIVDTLYKAIQYSRQQPAEANQIMAPHFLVDAAKYADILTGLKFTGLERNRQYFGTAAAPGPIFSVASRASQLWMEAGAISRPVEPNSIISTKFVTEGHE